MVQPLCAASNEIFTNHSSPHNHPYPQFHLLPLWAPLQSLCPLYLPFLTKWSSQTIAHPHEKLPPTYCTSHGDSIFVLEWPCPCLSRRRFAETFLFEPAMAGGRAINEPAVPRSHATSVSGDLAKKNEVGADVCNPMEFLQKQRNGLPILWISYARSCAPNASKDNFPGRTLFLYFSCTVPVNQTGLLLQK